MYDAFISYTRDPDAKVASAIRDELHRFGRKPFELRAMRVFMDQWSMTSRRTLRSELEQAIANSRHFVLIASPQSAQRPFVKQELAWWLQRNGTRGLHIVVIGGELTWDAEHGYFDGEKTDALPALLHRVFEAEPIWHDLRAPSDASGFEGDRFYTTIGRLSAAIRGIDPDTAIGRDVQEQRRLLAVRNAAIVVLVMTLLISAVSGGLATYQTYQRETAEAREAKSRSRLQVVSKKSISDQRERAAAEVEILRLERELSRAVADASTAKRTLHQQMEWSPFFRAALSRPNCDRRCIVAYSEWVEGRSAAAARVLLDGRGQPQSAFERLLLSSAGARLTDPVATLEHHTSERWLHWRDVLYVYLADTWYRLPEGVDNVDLDETNEAVLFTIDDTLFVLVGASGHVQVLGPRPKRISSAPERIVMESEVDVGQGGLTRLYEHYALTSGRFELEELTEDPRRAEGPSPCRTRQPAPNESCLRERELRPKIKFGPTLRYPDGVPEQDVWVQLEATASVTSLPPSLQSEIVEGFHFADWREDLFDWDTGHDVEPPTKPTSEEPAPPKGWAQVREVIRRPGDTTTFPDRFPWRDTVPCKVFRATRTSATTERCPVRGQEDWDRGDVTAFFGPAPTFGPTFAFLHDYNPPDGPCIDLPNNSRTLCFGRKNSRALHCLESNGHLLGLSLRDQTALFADGSRLEVLAPSGLRVAASSPAGLTGDAITHGDGLLLFGRPNRVYRYRGTRTLELEGSEVIEGIGRWCTEVSNPDLQDVECRGFASRPLGGDTYLVVTPDHVLTLDATTSNVGWLIQLADLRSPFQSEAPKVFVEPPHLAIVAHETLVLATTDLGLPILRRSFGADILAVDFEHDAVTVSLEDGTRHRRRLDVGSMASLRARAGSQPRGAALTRDLPTTRRIDLPPR